MSNKVILKLNLNLIIILLIGVQSAQTQTTILYEDFENGFPTGWSVSSNLCTTNWQIEDSASLSAVMGWGVPAHSFFVSTNTKTCFSTPGGYTLLTTPVMNIAGNSFVHYSLDAFESAYGYEYIKISVDGGPFNYLNWTFTNNWTFNWERNNYDLSPYLSGATTFQLQFGLNLANVSNNRMVAIDNIHFYTITIDASTSFSLDESYHISSAPIDIVGATYNHGSDTINSMVLNYQINGVLVRDTLTGLSIEQGDSLNFSRPWIPSLASVYNLAVWASNINGQTDQISTNDTAWAQTIVYDQTTLRKPLIESFSGANCPPCFTANLSTLNPLLDSWDANGPLSDITALAYQWWDPADPCYNNDINDRFQYLQLSAVPTTIMDGKYYGTGQSFFVTDSMIVERIDSVSYIELSTNYTIIDSSITVDVSINSLLNFPDSLTLHIAIVEDSIHHTQGTTGEVDFYRVVRKMLPDANGTNIPTMQIGSLLSFSKSYTFTIGNVTSGSYNLWEGMTNLTAVVFVENPETKEILQSEVASFVVGLVETPSIKAINLFPNPCKGSFTIDNLGDLREQVQIEILDVLGQKTAPQKVQIVNGQAQINLNMPTGTYFVSITSGTEKIIKKVIVWQEN